MSAAIPSRIPSKGLFIKKGLVIKKEIPSKPQLHSKRLPSTACRFLKMNETTNLWSELHLRKISI